MDDGAEKAMYFQPETACHLKPLSQPVVIWPKAGDAEPNISQNWSMLKRMIDVVGAIIILAVLFPVLCVIFAMIANSSGAVIFRQQRIGYRGRSFTCYKFRTMVTDAEAALDQLLERNPDMRAEWERDEKLRNDPRITAIGWFLRKTSLDELPQLFNVLKGDMSLVGPRPVYERDMIRYGRGARWYLAVRPGMTGLWQVSGRNEVSYRRRVALDIYYVRSQSFLLDFQILLKTAKVVLKATGY